MRLRRLIPLVVACAVLVPAAPAAAQDPTTMVVVETASVRVAPDTARIQATIRRRAGTPASARRRVEQRVAEILRALARLKLPRADIRTGSVRSYATRRKGRLSHVATTTLNIRTQQLDRVGRIFDALGGASIEGPEFDVVDSTAARQEATRLALTRARARADAAAAAIGQRVLAIRKVDLNPEWAYDSDSEAQRASGLGGSDDSDEAASGVEVRPGEQDVFVAVAVIYDIGT